MTPAKNTTTNFPPIGRKSVGTKEGMEKTRQTRLEQAATKAMRDPYLAGWVQTIRAAVRFAESYAKKERAKALREAAEIALWFRSNKRVLVNDPAKLIADELLSLAKKGKK